MYSQNQNFPCCKYEKDGQEILLTSRYEDMQKEGAIHVQPDRGEGEVQFRETDGADDSHLRTVREEKLDMTSQMRDDSRTPMPVKPIDTHQMPLKEQPVETAMPLVKQVEWERHNMGRDRPGIKELSGAYHPAMPPLAEQPATFGEQPATFGGPVDLGAEGQKASPLNMTAQSPRGDIINDECRLFKVDDAEFTTLETLVAKLAGSPLGCIDFERTFRTRQLENQINLLKGHALDGVPFGDICTRYRRVTILGLRNSAGRVIWAPAPYIRVHASDDILLMECTPYALAMGLSKESSLAQSSLSPRSSMTPPGTDRGGPRSYRSAQDTQRSLEKPVRRCCV